MREEEDSTDVLASDASEVLGPMSTPVSPGGASQGTTPNLATGSRQISSVRSSSPLRPWPEEADFSAEGHDGGSALRVVSLNLGGRNTNPIEFELKGDRSELAMDAMAILKKAGKAMNSAEEGPLLMPDPEMKVVQDILAEIFGESVDEAQSDGHSRIQELLRHETWAKVLAVVRATKPHMFNAFNLYTLKLNRPSVWENPASCREFTGTKEYLTAWKQWYRGLDRSGNFWLEDAPRVANKRGIDVATAFAGLLVFDVMCLCTSRRSMSSVATDDELDGIAADTREVPFKDIARFAAKLPASSLTARHTIAQKIAEDAHALLAQEARSFANHPTIAEEFLPPFCAQDGFTAVFLRKDSFKEATDITAEVVRRVEELTDEEVKASSQVSAKAWRTTASRLAAVLGKCHPQCGGFRVCLVSLHASKSDCTADFMEKLRDVLADYDADINIVGMDSNCAGHEASEFQKRLWNAGFEIGCTPKQQQVTVAKQRTAFQTQIQKVGDLDISHKDYVVSWTSPRVVRGRATYTPDLRTSYGVEQETKQCVRLPTTEWPFDHCGVATSFEQRFRCKAEVRCSRRTCCICAMVSLILILCLAPLASPTRSSPYGEPGAWYHDGWIGKPRFGICETAAPCPPTWVQAGDSCYVTTPKMAFPSVQRFCEEFNGTPITIDSEAENQLVVQSLCPRGDFCYIGLLGDFDGADYWVSGEPINYSRLVQTGMSPIPLFENSRSTDYVATILANMPDEVTGCDVRHTFAFLGGPASTMDIIQNSAPVLAVVWSGLLLAQRRPSRQRLASLLLLLAFFVNLSWAGHKLFNACFVDNFHLLVSVISFGNYVAAGGHTATSLLALWLIVRRMCMLYPSGALKRIFWALVVSMDVFFTACVLFIDERAPLDLSSWAVILVLVLMALIVVLYTTTSVLISLDLYHTWACLHREATNGCSSQGTTLTQLVRAAKVHLFAVFFAIGSGAVRWTVLMAIILWMTQPAFIPSQGNAAFMFATFLDSLTNDFSAHALAVLNMDAAVIRAKGVTTEVAERADREVEQHRLAVHVLKAAPTSVEQLNQLAVLEGKARAAVGSEQEKSSFLILQSAVRVETARIHRLMHCVLIRAMTMRLRYQHLMEVPSIEGAPRQYVPPQCAGEESEAAADKYFAWLYAEANGAQQVLFQQVQQLLTKFNSTPWPSDLGLAPEQFPWRIWAGSADQSAAMRRLQAGEVISPGGTWIHSPGKTSCLSRDPPAFCIALEETSKEHALIHRSGIESPQEVPRDELRTCHGGGVFIPGPQKKRQRALDKIKADYKGTVPWPAAASLVDICRCTVLCDDPYAMAVLVAYLRRSMKVVRLKNRFSEDVLESNGAEDLQKMFYAASDTSASDTQTTTSTHCNSTDHQYRDISVNVEVRTPSGAPFICEIQVALSSLAILKQADQKLYTIRRMKAPMELGNARVFQEDSEASETSASDQPP